ncbi:MAG TPA: phytanoyl-CoA dioxygenase family protein [Pyrinomonadaceae bacterium]|nr:phytanoyl-CoA dioxygenase family protein [Pyrinomonadaceae bacterium]
MKVVDEELIAFIRQCAVTDGEAESLVERALDPAYWLSQCPAMTITTSRLETGPSQKLDAGLATEIHDYKTYGHCAVHDAFELGDIAALQTAVISISQAGWPLIFAFVYDMFWKVGRTAKLRAFVSSLIGSEYQPTISFWVNHVPAVRGGSGFPPHMDDVWAGHHTVTCWVPLTPVTPDNGCIYVIERNSDNCGDPVDLSGDDLTAAQVLSALPRVRALPAGPGSFLAWPNDTIHWGGMYLRGRQARIALSFHFASADFENVDSSLRDSMSIARPLPRFEERLRWVSQSMLRFRGRDPLLERFAPVAHRLIRESGGEPLPGPGTIDTV